MDDHLKELIAIGASVAAHCQPCLAYHVGKARDLGLADAQIKDAINVGQLVGRGAASFMQSHIASVMDGVSPSPDQGCCNGGTCCP